MQRRRLLTKPVLVAGAAGLGSVLGAAAGSVAAAAYFARLVVTPDDLLPEDVEILDVEYDADGPDPRAVTLSATVETVMPGRYGIWLDGARGHARVGDIVDITADSVTRVLIAVDHGRLEVGSGRWNQYYYWDRPSVSLGLPDEDVSVTSDVGPLPGWVVRPEDGRPGTSGGLSRDWAVLVHGRGARKEETLRAVPVLRAAGWTSLVTAYRNDRDAPKGPDGRYNLGLSEWRDVEAAMAHALSHGAERILLFGWSMGGAIVLQALDQSRLADRVVGVCLDSAVLDWGAVLSHHARRYRLPSPLVRMARGLMGSKSSRRFVGVHEPIDVARTDWVSRAQELRRPMLVIHSDGDDFVPIWPAAALASLRPDIVTFERWETARHCREWNVDPQRWERVVRDFVDDL